MTKKQPYGTVLIKAEQILSYISSDNGANRLSDISKATKLTSSTASKILNTLSLIGYVQKDPVTQEFKLGPSLIKYANAALKQLDIKQIAQPYLEELQRKTSETVHLGILDQSKIVYVMKLESDNPVSLSSKIGRSIPLYCTAMGKAVLAEKTDEEIADYLDENPLIPKTEHTITDKETLLKEIQKVREQGFAYDDSEHELDVFCIGVSIPINEQNYTAISVSLPKYRLTNDLKQVIIDGLIECKANIMADLN